jgi:hypothetical protein
VKILRWFVAVIVGFIVAVVAGGIVVTIGEMSVWIPFPLAAGGVASAICFIYVAVKISGSSSITTVKTLSVVVIITAVISAAGSYIGQSSPMPALGLLIAAWVFLSKPDIFVRKKTA